MSEDKLIECCPNTVQYLIIISRECVYQRIPLYGRHQSKKNKPLPLFVTKHEKQGNELHTGSLSPPTQGNGATHPYTEATATSRVGVIDSTPQQGVRMMVYSPKILCLLLFPFCSPSTIHHIGRPLSINRSTERSERKCRHIVTLRKCPSLAIASINTHTMAFATWGPPYSCFFL